MNETVKDMKYDGGKNLAAIPFQDFPDAIEELVKVCTFGANKYERSSWKTVPNAATRYEDALGRHFLAQYKEDLDPESELYHKAHLAWNALATLQLMIEQRCKTDQIINKVDVLEEKISARNVSVAEKMKVWEEEQIEKLIKKNNYEGPITRQKVMAKRDLYRSYGVE